MFTSLFDISPNTLNLFSFILGMTFASFLSWYRRTAFLYIIGYFMCLAFYYGALRPNLEAPPNRVSKTLSERSERSQNDYNPPLPMPTPRGYK